MVSFRIDYNDLLIFIDDTRYLIKIYEILCFLQLAVPAVRELLSEKSVVVSSELYNCVNPRQKDYFESVAPKDAPYQNLNSGQFLGKV